MIQNSFIKNVLAVIGFLVTLAATTSGLTVVASLANVSPIIGLILSVGVLATGITVLHFIFSYLN